jgi:hypothetical protein
MNKTDIVLYSSHEAQVISYISDGITTMEKMEELFPDTKNQLQKTIENLLYAKIINFNHQKNCFEFETEIEGDRIILEGNVLLPVTVLKIPSRNIVYVTRGKWYSFPLDDFDIRRIIWKINASSSDLTATNSIMAGLIKSSILKERKTRNTQLEEYKGLQNKIIPYSKNIGLLLKTIGEEFTDITIIFKMFIKDDPKSPTFIHEFRGFTVHSTILTKELIGTLKIPTSERNYSETIKLNHLFKLSDFIFSNNEIPISKTEKHIEYIKLTGIRKQIELSYIRIDISGAKKVYETEQHEFEIGVKEIRELFKKYALLFLNKLEIEVEVEE